MKSSVSGTAWAPSSLTKRTMRGSGPGEAGELALVAVVPAEVEVAVGAVEQRGVGEDAGVGDHRPGAVVALQASA